MSQDPNNLTIGQNVKNHLKRYGFKARDFTVKSHRDLGVGGVGEYCNLVSMNTQDILTACRVLGYSQTFRVESSAPRCLTIVYA